MIVTAFAFVSGLIAANWIKLQFDDRLIELLSDGLNWVKCLAKQGIDMGWTHYQLQQRQDLSVNGTAPHQEVDLLQK